MSEKLKQCPFCKGEFAFDFEAKNFRCGTCGATVPPDPYARTVNTRPIEDELTTRIAELEGKIDQLTAHSDIERQDDKSSNDVATPIDVALRKRIAKLEAERRWRVVADGELPEVYRDEDGEFIPFLVCEGDGDRPFIAMYGGINWHAGIFVPDITHWMPLPELPEVK